MKVGFISLGCSKNLIDTEVAIGLFKDNHYEIVNNPNDAEILVVNTCGFIESAKEEAINTILEMAEYKKKKCKYLIAMGCLVQRYYDDLVKLLPEVDLFIKIDEYNKLWDKIEDLIKRDIVEKSTTKTSKKISEIKPLPMPTYNEFMERVVTTGKNYAYLKIGEGCSNKCTYCAIPYIRGPFVSRKMEDILDEAEMLAKKGIKELIVIAQDTTKYGVDIYGESKLAELLEKISKVKGIEWIRFLYSYPEGITDKLINVVATNGKIAKYFDIPIQHISNPILKKMNRRTSKEDVTKIIEKIRKEVPDVTLRTSLIVGFPGETKENFEELLEFVKNTKFDKLGTFMYSKEEGTPAAKLPDQIHGNTKKARYNKIMEAQQEISKEILTNKIGKNYKVLVEDMSFDGKYFIGRTMQDVPEEDGLVYIKNNKDLDENTILNNFVNCKIIEVSNYDLIGEIQK
ncbi:ribosomal protein S12 methylthiotransferase RimO [Clostridium sp. CAG:470]|nr:MAG: ribosomal protein S12 methylthiotransferase RimO [Clostridium sp. 28_17]CDE14887.1 ribosomal protein S12 methylthiotransferase RimO [Clostridium sp. CAG:470]